MSHIDSDIVSSVLSNIDIEYGNIVKMTITRSKIHKYLGMTINYFSLVKVKFSMVDYIGNMLDSIQEDTKGESATPFPHQLFNTAEDATKLS